MSKKMLISIICFILVAVIVISVVIFALSNDRGVKQSQSTDSTTESPTVPIEPSDTNGTEETTEKETFPEQNEDWFIPRPVPELDEENKLYLDSDVIKELTEMDQRGEEDRVNAILDGEILLVNHFAKEGYTAKALRQIQRFYFAFYDNLKHEDFEILIEKITTCVKPDGSCPFAFPFAVVEYFGWGEDTDFTYVFESEVSG